VAVGPWTMMAWKTTTTGGEWRARGSSLIDDKDNQVGGATGDNGNSNRGHCYCLHLCLICNWMTGGCI
jgi:hypothetical protein